MSHPKRKPPARSISPESQFAQVVEGFPPEKMKAGAGPHQDRPSNQATARLAAEILSKNGRGYVVPSAAQRENLLLGFVRAGYVVYGKAFDVVRLDAAVDLSSETEIKKHIEKITLYEIKSTSKENLRTNFRGYFFSISTAELLVAQNLGERYRFAFVNTRSGEHMELSLTELFARARGIYPSWSVQF